MPGRHGMMTSVAARIASMTFADMFGGVSMKTHSNCILLCLPHDAGNTALCDLQRQILAVAQFVPDVSEPCGSVRPKTPPGRFLRGSCQMRGQRALARTAFSRSEDKNIHDGTPEVFNRRYMLDQPEVICISAVFPQGNAPGLCRKALFRVVEDDADCVARSASYTAYSVPQIDAIIALRSLDRPVVHGERNRIALVQRHHLGPALHAGPLFVSTNSPPVKSRPGAERRIATCRGNANSPYIS